MNARRAVALVLVLVAALPALAVSHLETHVFVLRHRSPSEAGRAIEGMLSEEGSLTVQPARNRLTVQDRPEIVRRIARFLQQFDAAPPEFAVRLALFRASNGKTAKSAPADPTLDPGVLEKMRRMFRYDAFEPLGWSVVRGKPGGEVEVGLNDEYRVVFRVRVLPDIFLALPKGRIPGNDGKHSRGVDEKAEKEKKSGGEGDASLSERKGERATPAMPVHGGRTLPANPGIGIGHLPAAQSRGHDRLRLEHLQLLQRKTEKRQGQKSDGGGPMTELLRTTVMLSPGQSVVLGAAASEKAPEALVLVVEALPPAEE